MKTENHWNRIKDTPPQIGKYLLWADQGINKIVFGELNRNGQIRAADSMTFRDMNDFFTHWMEPPQGPIGEYIVR